MAKAVARGPSLPAGRRRAGCAERFDRTLYSLRRVPQPIRREWRAGASACTRPAPQAIRRRGLTPRPTLPESAATGVRDRRYKEYGDIHRQRLGQRIRACRFLSVVLDSFKPIGEAPRPLQSCGPSTPRFNSFNLSSSASPSRRSMGRRSVPGRFNPGLACKGTGCDDQPPVGAPNHGAAKVPDYTRAYAAGISLALEQHRKSQQPAQANNAGPLSIPPSPDLPVTRTSTNPDSRSKRCTAKALKKRREEVSSRW